MLLCDEFSTNTARHGRLGVVAKILNFARVSNFSGVSGHAQFQMETF